MDVDTIIIEEAHRAGHKHAILDAYTIDFKQNIQILNSDSSRQRPIRTRRFTFPLTESKSPFGGL